MPKQQGSVLIVVDVQKGFCPGGNLAIAHANEIIPNINKIAQSFEHVVLTQDWHPQDHISFASQHPTQKVYDKIQLSYGTQTLWPDHCIQATDDAAFHPDLNIPHAQLILRKGWHSHIDSYSAFLEADHKTGTGLAAYLHAHQITTVYVVGIATDFCVAWTAIDACKLGFECYVIADACKAIDHNGSLQHAWQDMRQHGVKHTYLKSFS